MSATAELTKPALVLPDLPALLSAMADAAQAFVASARPQVKARIADANGRVDRVLADVEQHIVHGVGWYASYAEMMREVATWATQLDAQGSFGEVEALLAQLLFAEYGAQMRGGIPMNQGEVIRPTDICDDLTALDVPAVLTLVRHGGSQPVKTVSRNTAGIFSSSQTGSFSMPIHSAAEVSKKSRTPRSHSAARATAGRSTESRTTCMRNGLAMPARSSVSDTLVPGVPRAYFPTSSGNMPLVLTSSMATKRSPICTPAL